jgi:hypothetical protein
MEMLFVSSFILSADHYIIDEYYDELVQILHKDLSHRIHNILWSISQSKRHHRLLE